MQSSCSLAGPPKQRPTPGTAYSRAKSGARLLRVIMALTPACAFAACRPMSARVMLVDASRVSIAGAASTR